MADAPKPAAKPAAPAAKPGSKPAAKPMAGAKKPVAKEKVLGKGIWTVYKVEAGKIIRKNKFCPKCGQGFIMAAHKDRTQCGQCNYTEFQTKAPAEKKAA